jgi:hypothetical protein
MIRTETLDDPNASRNGAATASTVVPASFDRNPEKHDPAPLFWRMFGSSVMAIACALGIVLYLQVTQSISSIRSDVTVLREGYVQLVPRSEYSKGHSQVSSEIQALQARNVTALEIWVSRVSELERRIERMRTDHIAQMEALQREQQQLRERMAVLESRSSVKAKTVVER